MRSFIWIILVTSELLSVVVTQVCYYPNGKVASGLLPCSKSANVTHCCRESDRCLTNGLCFSPGLGSLVRRGCTDLTWKAAECPTYCNSSKFNAGDVPLTPCGEYNNFCCGQDDDALACCSTNNGTQIGSGTLMECTTTTAVTATTTITSTATGPTKESTSTAPTTLGTSNCDTEKTTAIGSGAALGAAFFCALLALAALYWQLRRKKADLEHVRTDLANKMRDLATRTRELEDTRRDLATRTTELATTTTELKESKAREGRPVGPVKTTTG